MPFHTQIVIPKTSDVSDKLLHCACVDPMSSGRIFSASNAKPNSLHGTIWPEPQPCPRDAVRAGFGLTGGCPVAGGAS